MQDTKHCYKCRYCWCECGEDIVCGHPESYKVTSYGLSVNASRSGAGPCGQDGKLFEPVVAKPEKRLSMIDTEQLTFETETGGMNKAHYATAETAELMATMVRELLNDKYTVTVEFAGSQYPDGVYPHSPRERELWVKGRNDRIIERLNAGLIAHTVINRGEQLAKERVIAELRWAGADL